MTHVIRDDAEALAVAAELAEEFRPGAAARDLDRALPWREVDRLSASGLLAVTVPRAFGGAGVGALTVCGVVRTLAGADGSLGQIPQNHFWFLEAIRHTASPDQQRWLYGEVLAGARLGNAAVPARGPDGDRVETTLVADGDGWLLHGRKSYSTGALFADIVPVSVRHPEHGHLTVYVPRASHGLTVVDDWDAIGQRTTASGTVILDGVRVTESQLVPHRRLADEPTVFRAFGLLMHAAIDTGIAQAALRDGAAFLRTYRRSRPGAEETGPAGRDPVVVQKFGELGVLVRAARALLESAARTVDEARAVIERPGTERAEAERWEAEAAVAMAAARAHAHTAAMRVSGEWFELAGASAVVGGRGLDRHWRDARTHTLHDPRTAKVADVGAFDLDGTRPVRPTYEAANAATATTTGRPA